jgi:GTP pyrophosphokinase
LVDGLTKIEKHKFSSKEEAEVENFRKLILSMAKDFRVILIKIADRLHNMRTLDALRPDKQKRISEETLRVYAPLAARVGLWKIKNELEDLAFKHINPKEYERIKNYIAKSKKEQEKFLNRTIGIIKKELEKHNIKADIQYRVKHIYGIYEKMQRKNLDLQQIYDIYGIRILVDELEQCYGVLGIIHNIFEPLPDRFKDYIAKPKPNQYRALHTTVLVDNKPVEIQIKTYEMHEIAEKGIAAHFKYKGGKFLSKKEVEKFIKIRDSLEKLFQYPKDTSLIKDIKENLDKELILDEIYVFTPKKDVIKLPIDATPVDFAYRIHTEVGHRVRQAKVNGSIVPLDFKLKSGDVVEIITGNNPNPKSDWLKFVKTSKARLNIRQFLIKREKERSLKLGRNLLNKILKKIGKNITSLTEEEKNTLLKKFNLKNWEDLLIYIGSGKISVAKVIRILRKTDKKSEEKKQDLSQQNKEEDIAITVDNVNNILTKIAKCCMPIPGEEIVGIVLTGKGVSIHRKDCPNIQNTLKNEPERVLKAVWGGNDKIRFPAKIRVISDDKPGILADVSTIIAKHNTNIDSVRTRKSSLNQTAILDLVLSVKDKYQLEDIMNSINGLKGVRKVIRVSNK